MRGYRDHGLTSLFQTRPLNPMMLWSILARGTSGSASSSLAVCALWQFWSDSACVFGVGTFVSSFFVYLKQEYGSHWLSQLPQIASPPAALRGLSGSKRVHARALV